MGRETAGRVRVTAHGYKSAQLRSSRGNHRYGVLPLTQVGRGYRPLSCDCRLSGSITAAWRAKPRHTQAAASPSLRPRPYRSGIAAGGVVVAPTNSTWRRR